jgi:hypothetical protein
MGGHADDQYGQVEYHRWDPDGLHTYTMENHNQSVRTLDLRFLDRTGAAAHFGRIHLWFKLCVSHG